MTKNSKNNIKADILTQAKALGLFKKIEKLEKPEQVYVLSEELTDLNNDIDYLGEILLNPRIDTMDETEELKYFSQRAAEVAQTIQKGVNNISTKLDLLLKKPKDDLTKYKKFIDNTIELHRICYRIHKILSKKSK